ncbi:MAG: glycosyltransferase [Deltaproteobacteria bacterium]|nr:glycosyltransferase [Deltaproteobacteria bacterium]
MNDHVSIKYSAVIPVYNEEKILRDSIVELKSHLQLLFGSKFEIIISENGSTDSTLEIARSLENEFPEVVVISSDIPDYGAALKSGIINSRGDIVICDEIDLGILGFYAESVGCLEETDTVLVVGSKNLPQSGDGRPIIRKIATKSINLMLRAALGFRGTDTHGLKAFRKKPMMDIIESCVITKDLFASELVIRAQRNSIKIKEIPIALNEKRPPAINLFRRVPGVIRGMVTLLKVLGPR